MNSAIKPQRFRNYKHFYFETRKEVWFGPLKEATKALQMDKYQYPTEENYIEFLKNHFPEIFINLEYISFYIFQPGKKYRKNFASDFEYHIAVTYQKPNPTIRKQLYEIRNTIACIWGEYVENHYH